MQRIVFFVVLLLSIVNCSRNELTDYQRRIAEDCMNSSMIEASHWLDSLNVTGIQILKNHKYPPLFDVIMSDELMQEKLQKKISHMEQEFGAVKERKFFGIHVLFDGEILTYVPERVKTFKKISPRKLGVKKIEDYYKENIEGTYALLMYNSIPSKKDYAEELLVMWCDRNNKWWLVDYLIAENI